MQCNKEKERQTLYINTYYILNLNHRYQGLPECWYIQLVQYLLLKSNMLSTVLTKIDKTTARQNVWKLGSFSQVKEKITIKLPYSLVKLQQLTHDDYMMAACRINEKKKVCCWKFGIVRYLNTANRPGKRLCEGSKGVFQVEEIKNILKLGNTRPFDIRRTKSQLRWMQNSTRRV